MFLDDGKKVTEIPAGQKLVVPAQEQTQFRVLEGAEKSSALKLTLKKPVLEQRRWKLRLFALRQSRGVNPQFSQNACKNMQTLFRRKNACISKRVVLWQKC